MNLFKLKPSKFRKNSKNNKSKINRKRERCSPSNSRNNSAILSTRKDSRCEPYCRNFIGTNSYIEEEEFHFLNLPLHLLRLIFTFIEPEKVFTITCVSKKIYNTILFDDLLWKKYCRLQSIEIKEKSNLLAWRRCYFDHTDPGIPLVVHKCAQTLTKHLDVVGLFQISPDRKNFNELLDNSEDEHFARVVDLSKYDPFCVASLFKVHIREKEDPLLTYQHFDKFIALANAETVDIKKIKSCLKLLPDFSFHLLKFVCKFLWVVSSQDNFKGINNIALVFGSCFLRRKQSEETLELIVSDAPKIQNVVCSLLENYQEYFEQKTVEVPVLN